MASWSSTLPAILGIFAVPSAVVAVWQIWKIYKEYALTNEPIVREERRGAMNQSRTLTGRHFRVATDPEMGIQRSHTVLLDSRDFQNHDEILAVPRPVVLRIE
ncbi:hypothetical protein BP5796_12310 [Coleophoma crateriformis]|uniref:Uncharacterized protein n=1 Tax=Coleophoma crateriformis TaxID=565419 RepID=A0A3D8Q9N3_9HELO|nr:hypothetical protein BP5796_12310 [Coleophoma crateriformis]